MTVEERAMVETLIEAVEKARVTLRRTVEVAEGIKAQRDELLEALRAAKARCRCWEESHEDCERCASDGVLITRIDGAK